MTRNWLDPGTETLLLDEVAQRRRRNMVLRSTMTPGVAARYESWADAYPWMDPTAVQSLADFGISADDPAAVSIADLAARQAAEEGAFDTAADDVADPWYETLVNTAAGWAKPIVRTGFAILATPMEELEALLTSAGVALLDETEAPEGFDPAGTVAGLATPAGMARIGAQVAAEFSDPAKLVSDFWRNYTSKAARSTGLLALGDLLAGKPADLGEGFLVGGRIFEERERAKRRLTLDGHFMTPGRVVARTFTEPGTGAYQFLSGLSDFSRHLAADPSAAGLGA